MAGIEIPPISKSVFQFSSDLLQELPKDRNLVFSPFSLGLVLLMARFGARGQTAAQIENALRLPPTSGDLDDLVPIRRGFFKILSEIGKTSEDYNVTVANRMFIEAGFKIDKNFTMISKKALNVTVTPLNFTDGLNASKTINSWVRDRTNGKIDQLFFPDSFNNDTKLVMVNAVYFKSPWKYAFDSAETKRRKFENKLVNMMASEDEFPYGDLEDLNATVVSIPYKGDRFSMQVFIPKRGSHIGKFTRALKTTNMDNIRKKIRAPGLCEKVKLHLPKFTIESSLGLVEPLRKMGATDMFSDAADFSGIPRNATDPPKLFVSEVIQRAFIAVDEEGTEATAASGIRAGVTCSPSIRVIKADRPFYYQIVEDSTNTVLFAGVVRDPNP